ncbi:M28 family peptidase [bacterium]|nr:M28 family peptidase [bacterium]
MRVYLLFLGLTWASSMASAQTTPFLNDDEIDMFVNELSGDRAFEHIRALSRWHRDSGMDGFFKAADYIMQAAKDAGLEDVKFIEQTMDKPAYEAKSAELWMIEPVEVKLADIGDHAVHLADGSHDADLTAELVWIGSGKSEEIGSANLKNKIVLTDGELTTAAKIVWNNDASGIVAFSPSEGRSELDFPDQIAWKHLPSTPEGKKGTFAFSLPPRKGEILKRILQSNDSEDWFATGKKTRGGKVVLKAKVDTEFSVKNGRTGFVEAWIRGSKYHDSQIVLTAHLQEEQGSANDDGSGCANLLEFGRTFMKLINEGKMKRPLRDIRLWWTDEIYSEYEYFKANPDEPRQFLVNLHQDMTGARQSFGSRVQHLIFAPFSRTSYLDALFENITTYVIETNNGFLSASRTNKLPRPHTRPIYSTRGSREGYNAAYVPYFGQSDHMCFVDGAIGVPSVAMINWDDPYIHSSDDDLWQIDQTQLKRNNFIYATMAYVLGSAENEIVPLLIGETLTQGQKRLANDLKTANEILLSSKDEKQAWKDMTIVVKEGFEREFRAIESVHVFVSNRHYNQPIDAARKTLEAQKEQTMQLAGELFKAHFGKSPVIHLNEAETNASKKIPYNTFELKNYFTRRDSVKYKGVLHKIMREEAFNFVDGKRSYYDIYKAVRAEALTVGAWYYGSVELNDVVNLLDEAVQTKTLELKSK